MPRKIEGFADIHSHFLYGIDDGARTRQEMEAMLDAAHEDGICRLYATPHAVLGVRSFDAGMCAQRLEEAREYCRQRGYGMQLYMGAELMYTPALERFAMERKLPVLGASSMVLMEFVPDISMRDVREAVGLLERSGYTAVLAHVERYDCFFLGRNAWKCKENHTVLYQINAGSVVEGRGFLRDRYIQRWLRDGLVDFVASDAHNCMGRPFRMREAYASLRRNCGETLCARLTGLEIAMGSNGSSRT